MSGDATNASIWTDADVRVDFLRTTAAPTDTFTAYAAGWNLVGLLDGAEGFTEARDEETSEHYAWGGVLVKKTRSKHKRTIKFVAMEDNAHVFRLVNPGSTRGTENLDGVRADKVVVPKYEDFSISFETREGDVVKRRTVKRATIEEIDEMKDSEESPTVYGITVVIYPEADGTLYETLTGPAVDPVP